MTDAEGNPVGQEPDVWTQANVRRPDLVCGYRTELRAPSIDPDSPISGWTFDMCSDSEELVAYLNEIRRLKEAARVAEAKAALLDWWQAQDSGWRTLHVGELSNRYDALTAADAAEGGKG